MTQSNKNPSGEHISPLAVELSDISKAFGTVRANEKVNLAVKQGHIHGIIGENGAGKSTLVSILYGFYRADSGRISIDGNLVNIGSSAAAIANGIGMVHQHFMLVPNFTVLENIMLGHEGYAQLDKAAIHARAELQTLSDTYGLAVDPDSLIEDLPVGLQQRVEILKALFRGARILILDEPTGVLTPQETDQLFEILNALRDQGVTILFITHKLREIMAITDTVSVMRQGQMVAHLDTASVTPATLAELMVGRKVLLDVNHTAATPGDILLTANHLSCAGDSGETQLDDVSFTLRSGEIIGIAGVSGNGQSELLDILAGIRPPQSGSFTFAGQQIDAAHPLGPASLRDLGIAHVPEDRHRRGIVLNFSAAESMLLGHSENRGDHRDAHIANNRSDHDLGDSWWLDPQKLAAHCATRMQAFDVRPPDPDYISANFSGGNQQKLVLAREISTEPSLLLVGQPTRGVDIGAIEFIHQQLIELRNRGCCILLVSVELEEIMSLSDRILVMNNGSIVGEVARADADERTLGMMMAGIAPDNAPDTNPASKTGQPS
ncbi:ABC transporter ATP-binding protein [Candidatus Puniceispirillum marinum]|uniref:ABC transporter related protein n=1 Tax=Puniceispirillum marinum (strain IMCC1322) TaxID=488538 RepID=D5BUA3_PUNMI|nr:ABC transporter ATP-binding protein [Candidatus Puniceispirillum marinum]ADE39850.1 ABC transporter related protein [Candidatus Puniceispirillum marinum IMCC1322]